MSEALTPTQEVVNAAAPQDTTVKTPLGKSMVMRKLSFLDQTRLIRALGSQGTENGALYNIVETLFMIRSVNGVPVPMPTDEASIDRTIARLGDDVMNTAMMWRHETMLRNMAEIQNVIRAASEEALNAVPDFASQDATEVSETPAAGAAG